ncbi:MAG TPA: phenylalanine--tRNA ligase subunit beta [Stellaceae bacterium]|jgi:phenylalanyl-tRNA synthetase beta chain
MKTTVSWLKGHLDTEAGTDALVERLVMLGHDVDGVEDRGSGLGDFVTARVVSAEQHPQADRLRVCVVDNGTERIQVVCGAPNARAGMIGVFGRTGVTVPKTGTVLTESAIRGIASRGMLMSEAELKLSDNHDGIIDLPPDTPVGVRYVSIAGLDDPVIDIKVTPNRADCLGTRGLARDLAATGIGTLKPLDTTPVPGRFTSPIGLKIDDLKACPLFLGRHIRGLKNGPSPDWLKSRLESIGLRPISILVDITNFLTFDLDRPLHVFDAAKIARGLTVRLARAGEKMLALNGREYALDPEVCAIADDNGVQSLGGVMGGEPTSCTDETTDVFIEAALFDPVRTAATGRRLEIISDARYRFERGIDPEFTGPGLEIATRLILDLCGGEPSEIVVAGAQPEWRRSYTLRADRPKSLGGLAVAPEDSRRILETLGFAAEAKGSDLIVSPPPWRGDVIGEADLVEEVLRVKGYDDIPIVPLARDTVVSRPAIDAKRRRAELVRRILASRGLVETVAFSFISEKAAKAFGGGDTKLRLVNPIAADLSVMRPSVLPALVEAAQRNADRGFPDLALFELGPLYRDDTPAGQINAAAGIRSGRTVPRDWRAKPEAPDFILAKSDAIAALVAAGAPADNIQTSADPPAWYHPGRAGMLRLGPTVLGHFGELHPDVLEAFDVKGPVAAFEVFLDAVPASRAGRARPPLRLSVFQPVERDFAFVVDANVAAETLLRAARGADRKLVTDIRLFDVYEGTGLPDGKKSLAISVTLQPQVGTLTDAEIEAFSKRLVAAVAKATGGILRG